MAAGIHTGLVNSAAVDGLSSAVRHAQTLVALKAGTTQPGQFSRPQVKAHQGLPDAIQRLLAG